MRVYIFTWILFSSLFSLITAQHYSIDPARNAFFLFSSTQTNRSEQLLYLHDDCAFTTDQSITVSTGGRTHTSTLHSQIRNYNCAVNVKVAQDFITLDRPYIDLVALSDVTLLNFFREELCVTVRVSSPTGSTVSATCSLTPYEEGKHSCLLRIQVPFSWFGDIGRNATKQILSLSHIVSKQCDDSRFYDRPQVPITLIPFVENAQAHVLQKEENWDLSLLSRANLSLALNSLNALFVHIAYNATAQTQVDEIELRVWLDSRFEVVNAAPLSTDSWNIRPVTVRSNLYTTFICKRIDKKSSFEGYLFAILLKMRGEVVTTSRKILREDPLSHAHFHWMIIRRGNISASNKAETHERSPRVATPFRVMPDSVYAVVPVPKSTELLNVAVLSNVQSTVSMRIVSVTVGGVMRDVTALSHCLSSENRVLKTSPTCSSAFVDGSELRGMAGVKVHVHYEQWTTHVAFTVWFPRLPITIWIRDPILNRVENWPVSVWRELDGDGEARQFGCNERFQHTEVRVLASFQVSDDRTGERMYLSGEREKLFDVTALALHRVQSADHSIAAIKQINGRLIAYAVRKGTTRLMIKSLLPQVDYGSATLMVSDDRVKVVTLSARPITGVQLQIEPTQTGRSQYLVRTRLNTTFDHRWQRGTLSMHVLYSDDQVELLGDVPTTDYNLAISAVDDTLLAVKVRHANEPELIALDDSFNTSCRVLLRPPPQCLDPDMDALADVDIPIYFHFREENRKGFITSHKRESVSSAAEISSSSDGWKMETLLALIFITLAAVTIVRIVSRQTKAFSGYEKLMAPLLSRLSSSSSSGRDEDTKEWVWVGRAQSDPPSSGSRYSRKSTAHIFDRGSPSFDGDTMQANVSYRGSEISVFIAPQPSVSVHPSVDSGSWRSVKPRGVRLNRQPVVESSSEYNMAMAVDRSGSLRGTTDLDWRSANHTWSSKRRPRDIDGLRESVA